MKTVQQFEPGSHRLARLAGVVLLGLVVVLVYGQVLDHDFLLFDDPLYVTENVAVRTGLSPGTVVWALFDTRAAHYWHPLTWISHMSDVQLFGLEAGRHLAVNVGLHLLATFLLLAMLERATGRFWESLVVAALFALHPQHVESVAWVSARKDVLSAALWFLTMLLYVRYAERPTRGVLFGAFACFVLGIAAKPFVITLPATLVLFDYWPLRRAPFSPEGGAGGRSFPTRSVRQLIWEKVPFFVVSGGVAALTLTSAGLGMFEEEGFPLRVTATNAAWSYLSYIGRTIWPSDLAAFYPHPGALPAPQVGLAVAVLASVSALAVVWARSRPHLLVGWLWFVGTLLPVVQLVQQARHGMADRYTYIPLIGLFVAAVWEIGNQVRRRDVSRPLVATVTAALLLTFSWVSWRQVSHWRNTETLFRHAVAVTEGNYLAHALLGAEFMDQGREQEAEHHLRETLRIRPQEPNSLTNLGLILASRGEYDEALRMLRKSAKLRPWREGAWYGAGRVLEEQGKLRRAESNYLRALRANRMSVDANYRLGVVLERQGRSAEAMRRYRRVLKLSPGHAGATASVERLERGRDEPGMEG